MGPSSIPEAALRALNLGSTPSPPSSKSGTSKSSQMSGASSSRRIGSSSLATSMEQSAYWPSDWERSNWYHGVCKHGARIPVLLYRSSWQTAPMTQPIGPWPELPRKVLRGVHGTSLNSIWDSLLGDIGQILEKERIEWTSIDPVRFLTYPDWPPTGILGPPVVWIGVKPNSTTVDQAHMISTKVLKLIAERGAENIEVEWRESQVGDLAGPSLLPHRRPDQETSHDVHRYFTPLHGVYLATEDGDADDSRGTLTLWLHPNCNQDGMDGPRVVGITNAHVLIKDASEELVHMKNGKRHHVRICSDRVFRSALQELEDHIDHHRSQIALSLRRMEMLQMKGDSGPAVEVWKAREILSSTALTDVESFKSQLQAEWESSADRTIGYMYYVAPVQVDVEDGAQYMSDWGIFEAEEGKCKESFEGNTIDLGNKFSGCQLDRVFNRVSTNPLNFQNTFIEDSSHRLRIQGCMSQQDIVKAPHFDQDQHAALVVAKDGSASGLTLGYYAGLQSLVRHDVGRKSLELAIYAHDPEKEYFSRKGDSGALIWSMVGDQALIFGQLHAAIENSTGAVVTYATPGWFLIQQIKKKFPQADFYRETW